jgi:hypothetical protein
MKVVVYVEGVSDKLAMQELLESLLQQKRDEGIAIDFISVPDSANMRDNKRALLLKLPKKAVNLLTTDRTSIVVIMPDLYPRDTAFPHATPAEMEQGIRGNFEKALQEKYGSLDRRIADRFHVFCFKHDLEALVLASVDGLKSRLGKQKLKLTWTIPVEDQNHGNPPKRVVEQLFKDSGEMYKDTLDAPLILSGSNYNEVAKSCPQCFRPFVEFLEGLSKT